MAEDKEVTEVEEKKAAPAPTANKDKERTKVPSPKPAKRYSFAQWASRNNVPSQNRGGLRAYVNNINKHRTLEEWDECFKGY